MTPSTKVHKSCQLHCRATHVATSNKVITPVRHSDTKLNSICDETRQDNKLSPTISTNNSLIIPSPIYSGHSWHRAWRTNRGQTITYKIQIQPHFLATTLATTHVGSLSLTANTIQPSSNTANWLLPILLAYTSVLIIRWFISTSVIIKATFIKQSLMSDRSTSLLIYITLPHRATSFYLYQHLESTTLYHLYYMKTISVATHGGPLNYIAHINQQ